MRYVNKDGINKNIFWNGKYFVVHYFLSPFSRVIIIDPIKNEVYQWDDKDKILGVSIANFENEFAKEYVMGDDIRTLNWKATAKKNSLMVNQFQDEKSQRIYMIIDLLNDDNSIKQGKTFEDFMDEILMENDKEDECYAV